MGRPLNMNPEKYAQVVVEQQSAYIAELEAQLASGGGAMSAGNHVFEYSFSSNVAEPPASGQMRLDNSQTSATKIWLHKMTSNGVDVTSVFSLYHTGHRAYIQDKNDAARYARYTLKADPVFKTNHIELPVNIVASTGILNGGQPAVIAMTIVS